ncbi:MAG TPA: hypothetical protein VFL80_07415 [Thermoanaerobaculia bacterium]|nr:hypothetical protein [Thermoanaerobaculia bacterium]
MLPVVVVIAIGTIAPLIVLRGRSLGRYYVVDALTYAFAGFGWLVVDERVDPYLAAIALGVAKLTQLCVAIAVAQNVRWSAGRAALLAALIYAAVIPTQLRTPIDGDEPFYLLITESLVHDHDLDLRNQYRTLSRSATGRPDLQPQFGDPVGRNGEQFSRHEPFLSLLLIPGYAIGGLPGSIAIIALFGVLLVRSATRLLEEEGISDRTIRAVIPWFAFGPPIVFFATRIWPEVPGAFFFVEAVRGIRQERWQRWLPALFALAMLKLRFVILGALLVLYAIRTRSRAAAAGVIALFLPIAVVWLISGSATNVHAWQELLPFPLPNYAVGTFGLLLDGAAGFLFQAPFYLAALVALLRWREMPAGFRIGCSTAILYVVYLVPRSEWHGGWSPPLRYLVFLTPILLLGVATLMERRTSGALPIAALWTAGLLVHGLAYPWRLFHIASGENAVGEWLSRVHQSDFSRLFPSFIRLNHAALVGSIAAGITLLVLAVFRRRGVPRMLIAPLCALGFAAAVIIGLQPGRRVELEDAHVSHAGGELFPEEYTVARFRFSGGWIVREGDALSFLARKGAATLRYSSPSAAMIELAGHAYPLAATGEGYGTARVVIPAEGRVVLRGMSGAVNLDRLDHE